MPSFSSFFRDPKNKVIETARLTIRGHLLRWDDTALQISNISMVSPEKLPLPVFPILAVLLIIVGGLLSEGGRSVEAIGVIFALGGLAWIGWWVMQCFKMSTKKYLNIQLNSGGAYFLYVEDQIFLRQILQLLADIIEKGTTSDTNFRINVRNCEIRENGSIIQVTNESGD